MMKLYSSQVNHRPDRCGYSKVEIALVRGNGVRKHQCLTPNQDTVHHSALIYLFQGHLQAMATVSDVPDEPGQPPALTALSLAEASHDTRTKEQIITPFDVSGGVDEHGKAIAIDYDKLIDHFGSQRIDKSMLERFEKLTGKPPHRLLRRGLVFSHRDLNLILDKYEKGIPFFLYTGRGPSSGSMHVGHSVPFEFTKFVNRLLYVHLIDAR